MPAKCTAGMTRDALYKDYPENIEVRPQLNGRHEKPEIEWLIADILLHGQMEPVGIWDDGGEAVLAYGFSRWRAISEINKRKLLPEKLQIKCVYVRCNEQGAFIRNISENRQRNPTTPIDDAHNIQRLFNWDMKESDIAKIYFPTAATEEELKEAGKWVRERLNLIKLTPEAERAMKDGRLNETAAQAIAKLSSSQQREALKKDGKLSAKDIRASKPKKATKEKKPAQIDPELRRRITAVMESRSAGASVGCVQVDEETLLALENYINEK
jgi:hypothetical protein